ncbi:MAG: winged helix-turn-helix transcriptional regulator [Tissierellia bacterium]|nr:winged helix-turn-helix transcriptional regulator [Tissierellia bacterium]
MTPREGQIMELLRKNPGMSQKEIAKELNITRSGVSTHINNLVSAGYILGRGYILREEDYITVIGGANMDIIGETRERLIPRDSNPGKIIYSSGGVGRNITENLARLQCNVTFISVLGHDDVGKRMEQELRDLNVDTSNILYGQGETPHYLAVMNEDRDMEVAISDMEMVNLLNAKFLQRKKKIIESSLYTVLDTNLSQEALDELFLKIEGKYLVDGVSTSKIMKLKNHLSKIHFLKANIYEAQVLTSHTGTVEEMAEELLQQGLQSLVITMGSKGAYYRDHHQDCFLSAKPVDIVNASGAGDAFMAGYVYGLFHEYEIKQRLQFATACSRIALQSSGTSSEQFTLENIKGELKRC